MCLYHNESGIKYFSNYIEKNGDLKCKYSIIRNYTLLIIISKGCAVEHIVF